MHTHDYEIKPILLHRSNFSPNKTYGSMGTWLVSQTLLNDVSHELKCPTLLPMEKIED